MFAAARAVAPTYQYRLGGPRQITLGLGAPRREEPIAELPPAAPAVAAPRPDPRQRELPFEGRQRRLWPIGAVVRPEQADAWAARFVAELRSRTRRRVPFAREAAVRAFRGYLRNGDPSLYMSRETIAKNSGGRRAGKARMWRGICQRVVDTVIAIGQEAGLLAPCLWHEDAPPTAERGRTEVDHRRLWFIAVLPPVAEVCPAPSIRAESRVERSIELPTRDAVPEAPRAREAARPQGERQGIEERVAAQLHRLAAAPSRDPHAAAAPGLDHRTAQQLAERLAPRYAASCRAQDASVPPFHGRDVAALAATLRRAVATVRGGATAGRRFAPGVDRAAAAELVAERMAHVLDWLARHHDELNWREGPPRLATLCTPADDFERWRRHAGRWDATEGAQIAARDVEAGHQLAAARAEQAAAGADSATTRERCAVIRAAAAPPPRRAAAPPGHGRYCICSESCAERTALARQGFGPAVRSDAGVGADKSSTVLELEPADKVSARGETTAERWRTT